MPQEQPPASSRESESPALPDNGQSSLSVEPEDEALEFKPVVKYAGIALAFALLAGVEYATYTVGYGRGYVAGTESDAVQETINATAVKNLTYFMQAASSDEATLLSMVGNRQKNMAWILDADVRREAEWVLAQSLMERGIASKGKELLSTLIPEAPENPLWARRAAMVASALAEEGCEEEALTYYRLAAARYAHLQQTQDQIAVLSEMVELLAASPAPVAEVMASLDALQQEASALGEPAKVLRATIYAYMGGLYRRTGDSDNALRCFAQATEGMGDDVSLERASAAVSYGMALLEKGDIADAEKLLRDGVARLGDNPADVPFLVAALRELARLEQERGNTDEALGLLYRAEGAATGRIPADSSFWPCLFDQRGWLNLIKQLHESSCADFCKALENKQHPELLPQPLEGAGRCCLALGKAEEAVAHLQRAAELRNQYMPAAKADLGRVYLFMGQAYDMQSKPEAALDAYAKAVELLPEVAGNAAGNSVDRNYALMSMAYGYMQLHRWSDAYRVWSGLQNAFAEEPPRQSEVRAQMAICRRYGATAPGANTPAADNAAPAEGEEMEAEEADDSALRQAAPSRPARTKRRRH